MSIVMWRRAIWKPKKTQGHGRSRAVKEWAARRQRAAMVYGSNTLKATAGIAGTTGPTAWRTRAGPASNDYDISNQVIADCAEG